MPTNIKIKDKTTPFTTIKVEAFRKHVRTTVPHKHNNYFEIIYLTKGSGTHTIDTKTYQIQPPIVFTIRQEQVHFWDIQSEPEGFVLIIKKSFIDDCLDKDIMQLLSKLSAQNCLFPKDETVNTLFKLLLNQYQEKSALNKPIMDGLLKALFAKLLESETFTPSKTSNNAVFNSYIQLIDQKHQPINKVSYYANLLNTTPQNLNAICQKEATQSASAILSEHIIKEAKRLLLYTNFTISEIANTLGFSDNSHFTKYFKRHVNSTPKTYRKTNF
ncbi:AraC family transcriptional regulator [Lacinutrix undariae]